MDFSVKVLGSPLYMWILFCVMVLAVLVFILIRNREKIREIYHKTADPEVVIEVCIHNPGSQIYESYWRTVPQDQKLSIKDSIYRYDEDRVIKRDCEELAYKSNNQWFVKIEGKEYQLKPNSFITKKHTKWPQIHYFKNHPEPINWTAYTDNGFDVMGKDLNELIESDIVSKALSFSQQNALMMFIIILAFINMILTGITLAKTFGVLK